MATDTATAVPPGPAAAPAYTTAQTVRRARQALPKLKPADAAGAAAADLVVLVDWTHVRRLAAMLQRSYGLRTLGYDRRSLQLLLTADLSLPLEMPPGERRRQDQGPEAAGASAAPSAAEAAAWLLPGHAALPADSVRRYAFVATQLWRLTRDPRLATLHASLKFFPIVARLPVSRTAEMVAGLDAATTRLRLQLPKREMWEQIDPLLPAALVRTPQSRSCTHVLSVVAFEDQWLYSLLHTDAYKPYLEMKDFHERNHSGEKVGWGQGGLGEG